MSTKFREVWQMIKLRRVLAATALVGFLGCGAALAADNAPLFVNLTSDDPFRTKMAIVFSKGIQDIGHPLTIFLNDRGIFLASKRSAEKFPDQQQLLQELIAGGTLVIACPQCLKRFDIPESDLLPGVKVGSASLTGGALFKDGTQTLSW
jgi:predicted peroxiredoxin